MKFNEIEAPIQEPSKALNEIEATKFNEIEASKNGRKKFDDNFAMMSG